MLFKSNSKVRLNDCTCKSSWLRKVGEKAPFMCLHQILLELAIYLFPQRIKIEKIKCDGTAELAEYLDIIENRWWYKLSIILKLSFFPFLNPLFHEWIVFQCFLGSLNCSLYHDLDIARSMLTFWFFILAILDIQKMAWYLRISFCFSFLPEFWGLLSCVIWYQWISICILRKFDKLWNPR